MHEKEKRPAAEVVLTVLHAGGKFGDGGGYKVSGGLHGVGVSVVNALSERLDLEVKRDGHVWTQTYERGVPAGRRSSEGRADHGARARRSPSCPTSRSSRRSCIDFETLSQRMRETAFLTRGLRIELIDERGSGERVEFRYEGGIRDFVAYLNENKEPIHRKIVYFEGESEDGQAEVSMQWNSSYQESIFSFANNINTTEGGTHLSGFRSALTRTLNDYARKKGLLKEKDENLAGRGRARGPDRDRVGEAARPAVRGPDEVQARQPADEGLRRVDGEPQAGRVPRGEPAPRRTRSSARRSRPHAHATPRARRAT